MKYKLQKEEINDQIDLSPLIDMVFILLIFFMVTTTFVKDKEIKVNRPGASSASLTSDKSIKVTIDQQKKVYFEGREVEIWALQGLMREKLNLQKNKEVLVVTDLSVKAQDLIEVVDQIKLAGAEHIGVATDHEG